MISIDNLSRDWPDFSLDGIDLEVRDREYFVILGPTGAGKTLLLELIAGFYRPDKGRIKIRGEDVTDFEPENREIGFVYQDYSLFPHMTVEQNIKFGPKVNGFSEGYTREKVQEVLNLLDIKHLANRHPETLSGGEKQKVALARSLVLDPDVLLLDEPISALDVPSQEEMREELKRIHREAEITTLHVTHNREEASWLGDRIGVMKQGKLVQVGMPNQVFRRPKTEFVANFVGTDNIFKGFSEGGEGTSKIDIGKETEIEAITDKTGKVTACIRPEEILLSKELLKSSGRNFFEGEVTGIAELENTYQITVNAGKKFSVIITKRSKSEMGVEEGSKVYLTFKASAVHVL